MRFPTIWYLRPARLRPACAYAQTDQSLCKSLEYSMNIKLVTKHHLEVVSLKEGRIGSLESTLVKMPHCWKSRVTAKMICMFVALRLTLYRTLDDNIVT